MVQKVKRDFPKGSVLPDYRGEGIVNLMSSIAGRYKGKTGYAPLKALPSKELQKRTVLIVIDGMGYNLLKEHGKKLFMTKYLRARMTSVFPPTTAAAISTFTTGVAPQQHAYTGWTVHLKEVGGMVDVLPAQHWGTKQSIAEKMPTWRIFDTVPFTRRIKARCAVIQPHFLAESSFSMHVTATAKFYGYGKGKPTHSIRHMFDEITRIFDHTRTEYMYAYWDELDHLEHDHGATSKAVLRHLHEIDREFKRFVEKLQSRNITIIMTADHGHRDVKKIIYMRDHTALRECLVLPLSGEPRTPHCYVRPHKVKDFERYVNSKLSKYCVMRNSSDLIKEGLFGLGTPHPKLHDRVGDYILLMNEGTVLHDRIKDKDTDHTSWHAGLHPDEMFVPLIVFQK